uniref:Glycylpeptide N-tetradecanoyltransferase n=1 Tax=Angiostrongylus cantonensis TaxID=6313 RepID=A0A0K0DG70_ANGCA
ARSFPTAGICDPDKNFAFWSTQPVPQFDEEKPETENTFIEPDLPLDKIRSEPYSMPESFVWSDVDLNDEKQLQELYTLLTENYVEDDDNMFRFDYSAAFLKCYSYPRLVLIKTPATSGLRLLEKKDISSAWKLLSEYLKRFCLAPVFTKKEFEHVFTPIEDVVYTYVVETGGKVTDMLSFYSLPSSVMHHPTHKSIRAVYSFYNVATTVPFKQLMNDALIFAQKFFTVGLRTTLNVCNVVNIVNGKIPHLVIHAKCIMQGNSSILVWLF